MIRRSSFKLLVALGAALLLLPGRASAHFLDSSLVVADVPVGRYHMTVWAIANVADGTSLHLSSQLTDPETRAPVLAAGVRYVVQDLQGLQPEILCDAAPATPVNGFLFEGDVPLDEYGSYRVTVEVDDPGGEGGEASFVLPVYPLSQVMQVIVTILLVIGLIATGWIIREGYLVFVKDRRVS